jgi:hypothetical protein
MGCRLGLSETKGAGFIWILAEADKGNLEPFVRFVGESLVSTQKVIFEAL